jgi:phage shock protein PspC (stress-responsive transcriptional regulator)
MVRGSAARHLGSVSTPAPPSPPQDPQPHGPQPEPQQPRRLYRSRTDRVLGGVCGGLAQYFRIDPIIVRLAAVALVLAGGAGVLLYIAALLLVPEEGGDGHTARTPGRTATIAGVLILVVAAGALLPGFGGWGWGWGNVLGPVLILAAIGLAVWWLASGEGPSGSGRDVARRIGLGLLVLALCGALAAGSFWAAAAGGGTAVAALVIAAGVALVAGAFAGGARRFILPALAVALPAAFVSAAGIDARGGVGDREYRPAAADQVRNSYRLGVGRLVVDLRGTRLPAGDRPLRVRLGVGQVVVVVPHDVCVATTGRIGMGAVERFDRQQGGVDVDLDERPAALAGNPRLVVDADIGVGALQVRHTFPDDGRFDGGPRAFRHGHDRDDGVGNVGCAGSAA